MCRRDATIVDSSFRIPSREADEALETTRRFLADLGWEGELPDLTVAFRLFGVVASGAPDRSIEGLQFRGQLLEELEDFFVAIAPHVEAGSYLAWRADSGEEWRYDFDGAELVTSPE